MASPATMPRVRAAVLLLTGLMAWPAVQQPPPAQAPKTKKNPYQKLVEPWPAPEKMKERRETAEALPLFADTAVLPVTLVADFKAINKDHDPNSKQLYPGSLKTAENVEL